MRKTNFEAFYLSKAADMFSLYNIGCPHVPYMEPLRINETGAMIYEKLKDGFSLEQISNYISSTYGVDEKESLQDVRDFADKLIDFGVLLTTD